ncbi:DNA repair protein RecO [Candidatus Cerribacteria bacterium 'Amazon FNV 2010 28 9']|uniref:DNA repair protein RecO n=1 Tax=Candidatus Cerribacteria bacterium 'Amazon FNV 2010 28 9' TaxID=2081795 RepID=A0A317JSD8_9BACT|nr:MAG: DNA repair protein RecO [Candidatus Cerribacteria bacterium 'Amazon FNV 2010 28 9']
MLCSYEYMKTFSITGIVLKRVNVGETDRIVTLFTKERGKIACVAKGVRKLSSSKLAVLEPGCEARIYCVETKSLPILTQAQLLNDFHHSKQTLPSVKKMFQILETIDALLFEEDVQENVYTLVHSLLTHIDAGQTTSVDTIRETLRTIISLLGFEGTTPNQSIMELIEELTAKKMKSFEYLTVGN